MITLVGTDLNYTQNHHFQTLLKDKFSHQSIPKGKVNYPKTKELRRSKPI